MDDKERKILEKAGLLYPVPNECEMKQISIDGKAVLVNMDKVCAIADNYIQFDGGHVIWGKVNQAEFTTKHGHWEKKGGWYWCSVCGDHWAEDGANYCPNCGAEMDEVET